MENPLPIACVGLLPLLPLLLISGITALERAGATSRDSLLLGPGVAIAGWLCLVHFVGRAAGFVPAFVLGTLIAATPGALRAARWLRAPAPIALPFEASTALVVLLATLAIAPSLPMYFHDETVPFGHLSTVAQLLNGWYPPHFMLSPEHEFRYHYGFDVLAAMLAGMLHVDASTAIDVATVGLFAYTGLLLGRVGETIVGARHGAITAGVVLLAGGIPFFCPAPGAPFAEHLLGTCSVGPLWVNPPIVSYLFQHPFALGIPLGLVALLLLADRDMPVRWPRYAVLSLLLLALSFSQIVIFATFGATLVVAEVVRGAAVEARRLIFMMAVAACVLPLAWLAGGFFLPTQTSEPLFQLHAGVGDDLSQTVEWLLRSFGAVLPLGLVGLLLLRRERLAFAVLALGSLLVVNSLRYMTTWDIVKFATVGMLVLAIAASATLARLAESGSGAPRGIRRSRRLVAGLLGIACMLGGVAFQLGVWRGRDLAGLALQPVTLGADDDAVASWLRRRIDPQALVYRRAAGGPGYNPSLGYMQHAGLATLWLPVTSSGMAFGFRDLRPPRRDLLRRLPPERADYLQQGIRWLVLDADDEKLLRYAKDWEAAGAARKVFTHGELTVIELIP